MRGKKFQHALWEFHFAFCCVRYKMKRFPLGYLSDTSLCCPLKWNGQEACWNAAIFLSFPQVYWNSETMDRNKPSCLVESAARRTVIPHHPRLSFLKIFQFICNVAKQLFPARCRTLVFLSHCYRWCHRSINICDTVFTPGFSRQLVKAQTAAAGVSDCPAGRIGRFWKYDKTWFGLHVRLHTIQFS